MIQYLHFSCYSKPTLAWSTCNVSLTSSRVLPARYRLYQPTSKPCWTHAASSPSFDHKSWSCAFLTLSLSLLLISSRLAYSASSSCSPHRFHKPWNLIWSLSLNKMVHHSTPVRRKLQRATKQQEVKCKQVNKFRDVGFTDYTVNAQYILVESSAVSPCHQISLLFLKSSCRGSQKWQTPKSHTQKELPVSKARLTTTEVENNHLKTWNLKTEENRLKASQMTNDDCAFVAYTSSKQSQDGIIDALVWESDRIMEKVNHAQPDVSALIQGKFTLTRDKNVLLEDPAALRA